MEYWIYDWECYTNFACVTFIHSTTSKELVKAYIEVDMRYLSAKRKVDSATNLNEESKWIEEVSKLIEVKEKLLVMMNVKRFVMYNSPTDKRKNVCQLGELLMFFNTHKVLMGYNSFKYDSLLTDYILLHGNKYNLSTGKNVVNINIGANRTIYDNVHITSILKEISNEVISIANSDLYYYHYPWKPSRYSRTFEDYDIQKILYLDKTFVGLKSIAISLKWHRIQELPIHHESVIQDDQIYTIMDYNFNDDLITLALAENQVEELLLREQISERYNIDVRNDSRSSIGKRLMSQYYASESGLDYKDFKDLRTTRASMRLDGIISDRIKFVNSKFKDFLNDLKSLIITPGDDFNKLFEFNGTYYTIAKGGIHSIDDSRIYDASIDNCIYRDADVTSYYPSILLIYLIYPNHLDRDIFLKLVKMFKDDRVNSKHLAKKISKKLKEIEKDENVIKDTELLDKIRIARKKVEDLTLEAEALKIVINRIYGALKDINDYLFDPKATYQTTMNGQLALLMLIEKLEINGIRVISANTDGIVAKLSKEQESLYNKLCREWELETEFELEYTDYEKYIRVNVNNYVAVKKGFKNEYVKLNSEHKNYKKDLKDLEKEYVKFKSDFIEEVSFNKGFVHPIVSIALKRFVLYDIDYKKTIYNHWKENKYNIYDYCISQKVDKSFEVIGVRIVNGEIKKTSLQQYNRFYVCTKNGMTITKHKGTKDISIIAKQNLRLFNDYEEHEDYDINYNFYIRKVEEFLYYKKKQSKGNHKLEGLLVRGNDLFSNID